MTTPVYEQKDGSGAAFYQSSKRNQRSPDWTGKFTWKGEELELAMWERRSKKDNAPYMSFVIKQKFVPYQPTNNPPPRPVQAAPVDDFNDDIPF